MVLSRAETPSPVASPVQTGASSGKSAAAGVWMAVIWTEGAPCSSGRTSEPGSSGVAVSPQQWSDEMPTTLTENLLMLVPQVSLATWVPVVPVSRMAVSPLPATWLPVQTRYWTGRGAPAGLRVAVMVTEAGLPTGTSGATIGSGAASVAETTPLHSSWATSTMWTVMGTALVPQATASWWVPGTVVSRVAVPSSLAMMPVHSGWPAGQGGTPGGRRPSRLLSGERVRAPSTGHRPPATGYWPPATGFSSSTGSPASRLIRSMAAWIASAFLGFFRNARNSSNPLARCARILAIASGGVSIFPHFTSSPGMIFLSHFACHICSAALASSAVARSRQAVIESP